MEKENLAKCLENWSKSIFFENLFPYSLLTAEKLELKSLSIPAISSGIFGFPKMLCAKILIAEAVKYGFFSLPQIKLQSH